MQLAHIAIWTNELERSRDFYIKFFQREKQREVCESEERLCLLFRHFRGRGFT